MGSGSKARQRADCIRAFLLSQEGRTNREIAKLLQCAPEKVAGKINRGRLALIRDERITMSET